MIKISKSVEYSILALKYISDNEKLSGLSSRKISNELNIPYELLSKLLQRLVKQGIIKSKQGKYGGYNMVITSDKLSVLQIIHAVEESVQLTNCTFDGANFENCSRIDDCCIRSPFWNLQNKIIRIFDQITLKELIN